MKNSNIFLRLKKRGIKTKGYRAALKDTMDGDIVWTVNPSVVRTLGKELLEYSDRHVMQLMELTDTYPMFRGAKILKFNIFLLYIVSNYVVICFQISIFEPLETTKYP